MKVKLLVIEVFLWGIAVINSVDLWIRIVSLIAALAAFFYQFRKYKDDHQQRKEQLHQQKEEHKVRMEILEQELGRQILLNKKQIADGKEKDSSDN